MTRIFILLIGFGLLASCTQYREPQANCFSFLAAVAPVTPDCLFTPIEGSEGDVEA